jgi:hypothetical protein
VKGLSVLGGRKGRIKGILRIGSRGRIVSIVVVVVVVVAIVMSKSFAGARSRAQANTPAPP